MSFLIQVKHDIEFQQGIKEQLLSLTDIEVMRISAGGQPIMFHRCCHCHSFGQHSPDCPALLPWHDNNSCLVCKQRREDWRALDLYRIISQQVLVERGIDLEFAVPD